MIWLILAVGLILRLVSLDQSLWLDEAINVLAAKSNSFWQILTEYPKFDFHPPGYFLILWGWIRIFGYSEVAVRMPSVIFGVATVWIVFLIGKKLISENLGVLAALILATSPLHIYYSQEARMYSFAAFAVTLNFFLFIKFLKKEYSKVFLILSNLLIFLSDYLTYFIFPAQFIFLLITKKTQFIKTWLTVLIITIVSFIWWLPILVGQVNIGKVTALSVPGWKMVVGEAGIKPLILTYVKFIIGRISHPDHLTYTLLFLPVGFLFAFLIIQARKSDYFAKTLLLSWIGIPIFLAWFISFVIPVYSYFRLLFVLPAFFILVALGILTFKTKMQYLILSLVILIEFISSGIYLVNPVFQREDWRGLVKYLKSKPSSSKILFESNGSFAPFDYYSGNEFKGRGALKNFPAKDLDDLGNLTDLGPSVYLIDYLVEISDPNKLVSAKLKESGYKQVDIKNFNGVGFVYHYIKQ